jgi:hypothetical protein
LFAKQTTIGIKFNVAYDKLEKLKNGMATELPSQTALYTVIPREYVQGISSRFGIWVNRGEMDFNKDTSLNKKLPELKTLKLNYLKRLGKSNPGSIVQSSSQTLLRKGVIISNRFRVHLYFDTNT